MTSRGDDRRDEAARSSTRRPRRKPDAAFDLWLNRGLHQLFDAVAGEPIPEDLLKIIEDDKQ